MTAWRDNRLTAVGHEAQLFMVPRRFLARGFTWEGTRPTIEPALAARWTGKGPGERQIASAPLVQQGQASLAIAVNADYPGVLPEHNADIAVGVVFPPAVHVLNGWECRLPGFPWVHWGFAMALLVALL